MGLRLQNPKKELGWPVQFEKISGAFRQTPHHALIVGHNKTSKSRISHRVTLFH